MIHKKSANFATLDPALDKEKYKKQIVEKIQQQFVNETIEEIEIAVESEYERLLQNATVLMHIPALTQGAVSSMLRQKRKS